MSTQARTASETIQFTRPGSGGSIQFGTNLTSARPTSARGLRLAVCDIAAARGQLVTRLRGRVDPTATSFASASDPARALEHAAAAHGEHARRIGQADPDWPNWYAEYLVSEQAGEELPS